MPGQTYSGGLTYQQYETMHGGNGAGGVTGSEAVNVKAATDAAQEASDMIKANAAGHIALSPQAQMDYLATLDDCNRYLANPDSEPPPHIWASQAGVGQVAVTAPSSSAEGNSPAGVAPSPDVVSSLLELASGVALDAIGLGETAVGQQTQALIGLGQAAYSVIPKSGLQLVQYPSVGTGGGDMGNQAQLASIGAELGKIGGMVGATSPSPGNSFVQNPGDSTITAALEILSGTVPYLTNPNVRIVIGGSYGQADPSVPVFNTNLDGLGPYLNLPGESDVDMLVRVTGLPWYISFGEIWPQWQYTSVDDLHASFTAYYVPFAAGGNNASSIVSQFFHLWDYTPSSGPPTRNGITDYIKILSSLPFQFGP